MTSGARSSVRQGGRTGPPVDGGQLRLTAESELDHAGAGNGCATSKALPRSEPAQFKEFQAACFSRVPLSRRSSHVTTESSRRKRDRDSNTGSNPVGAPKNSGAPTVSRVLPDVSISIVNLPEKR